MEDQIIGGSFYVRIDSGNVFSNDNFLDNSSTSFKNLLPNPLVLTRERGYEWQVALADLVIPNGFYNIPENLTRFTHQINTLYYSPGPPNYLISNFKIPAGFYDPVSFVAAVNKAFEEKKPSIYIEIQTKYPRLWEEITGGELEEGKYEEQLKFKIRYSPETRRYSLRLNENIDEALKLYNSDLRHTLGCSTLDVVLKENGPLAFPCNMNRFYANLFVSCDIVKYSIIGNQMSPLIGVFHLSSMLNKTYDSALAGRSTLNTRLSEPLLSPNIQRRQYYPVKDEVIKSIGLHLSNEDGKIFHFDHTVRDSTLATLHFRRVKQIGRNS